MLSDATPSAIPDAVISRAKAYTFGEQAGDLLCWSRGQEAGKDALARNPQLLVHLSQGRDPGFTNRLAYLAKVALKRDQQRISHDMACRLEARNCQTGPSWLGKHQVGGESGRQFLHIGVCRRIFDDRLSPTLEIF